MGRTKIGLMDIDDGIADGIELKIDAGFDDSIVDGVILGIDVGLDEGSTDGTSFIQINVLNQ